MIIQVSAIDSEVSLVRHLTQQPSEKTKAFPV
jgi:hypothetical protein